MLIDPVCGCFKTHAFVLLGEHRKTRNVLNRFQVLVRTPLLPLLLPWGALRGGSTNHRGLVAAWKQIEVFTTPRDPLLRL